MDEERARLAALALTDGIGWKLLNRLLEHFGSAEAILAASVGELQKVRGIGRQLAARIRQVDAARYAFDLRRFAVMRIAMILWFDASYPEPFKALDDRPPILFQKGALSPADSKAIAIVGTRQPNAESVTLAGQWAAAFARQGWTVVSGLARGIDTQVHRSALEAGGRTIAVLGCGLNQVYPPENAALAARIVENGVLLSEVHPESATAREALVLRNRLITALSRAVIVMEAGPTSGAIHAARRAQAQGRPVFAPRNSEGNAALLDEFAHLLPRNPADVHKLIAKLEDA